MKENKTIKLEDSFRIDDSHSKIKGFAVIEDKDGHIIFKGNNMIVKTGRKFILENDIPGILSGIVESKKLFIVKGNYKENNTSNPRVVSPNDTYGDINWNKTYSKTVGGITNDIGKIYLTELTDEDKKNKFVINFDNLGWTYNEDTKKDEIIIDGEDIAPTETNDNFCFCAYDSENLILKLLISIRDNQEETINTIGLCCEDKTAGNTLISRLAFPAYHKTADARLTFKYCIYF